MSVIAIVEKNKSNFDWGKLFGIEDFDHFELSPIKKDKLAKKDITLEIDKEEYDYIIAVGAEPTKFFSKLSSVVSHTGTLIEGNILPLINPNMVKLKPETKYKFDKSVESIKNIITGKVAEISSLTLLKIQDEQEAFDILNKILKESDGIVGTDIETTSLYCRKGYILGISLSWHDNKGVYIHSDAISERCEKLIQEIANTNVTPFHGGKFDRHFLSHHFGFTFPNYEDTMMLHYSLDENNEHGLKDLCIEFTDLGDYEKDLVIFKKNYCRKHKVLEKEFTYDLIPFEILADYAAIDAIGTRRLYKLFFSNLKRDSRLYKLYKELLLPGIEALSRLEDNGIPFSKKYLENTSTEIANHLLDLELKLYEYDEVKQFEQETGKKFNPNSPQQVVNLIYNTLGLGRINKFTDTGAYSMDEEVLTQLADSHDIPRLILEIKKDKKIKSTYIDKVLEHLDTDGRLRTNFNLHVTTSGRLSSSGTLNAQQIPRDDKRVKKCIRARPGYKIVSQDLKTAEVFIAAALAKDFTLLDTFKRGEDFHGFIAKIENNLQCDANDVKSLYPDIRQAAKNFSFRVLYALEMSHPVLKKFTKLKKWLTEVAQEAEDNGYIYTITNRKRRVPNVFSSNKQLSKHYVRSAVNALVQGPSSDLNLMATIELFKWIDNKQYGKLVIPFMLVHDSIVSEVHESVVDEYVAVLAKLTKKDYFNFIPAGYEIGVDVEIGDSYAFET